tara:strand:+ start:338 stop:781 length:444 start_codon:yes stop_codon:yes gene_type:complete
VKNFVTFRFSKNESIVPLKGIREDEETRFRGRLDVDEEEERYRLVLVEMDRFFIVTFTRTRTRSFGRDTWKRTDERQDGNDGTKFTKERGTAKQIPGIPPTRNREELRRRTPRFFRCKRGGGLYTADESVQSSARENVSRDTGRGTY